MRVLCRLSSTVLLIPWFWGYALFQSVRFLVLGFFSPVYYWVYF